VVRGTVRRWIRGVGPELAASGLAVASVARVAGGSLRRGFPVDDAWIHMVYGLALRQEQTLAYNTGRPATGSTSPLWAAVAALAHVLAGAHGPSQRAAIALKLLGGLLFAGSAVLASALARACAPGRSSAPFVGLAAGTLVAASPILAYSAASGMEVPLTSALLLAALLAAARRRALLGSALAGVALLARPEAAVALPIVFALAALAARRQQHGKRVQMIRRCLAVMAVAAAPAACMALRNWHVSGKPLPATFYQKAHGLDLLGLPLALRLVFSAVLGAVRPTSFPLVGLLVVVAAAAGLRAVVRRGDRVRLRRAVGGGAALVGLGYVVGVAVVTNLGAPWTFYYQRYVLPPMPLLIVGAVSAGAWASWSWRRRARLRGWSSRQRAVLGAVGFLGALATVTWEVAGWSAEAARYAVDVKDIDALQVATGKFIHTKVPADGVVWSQDAGAIRYWGRRRTLDLGLLNTPELFHGAEVDPAWWPDTIVVVPALLQVMSHPGLMDQIGTATAPSDPSNPAGIHIVLRCRPDEGQDRRVYVAFRDTKLALGRCARAGD
jgi:hypothetical protein